MSNTEQKIAEEAVRLLDPSQRENHAETERRKRIIQSAIEKATNRSEYIRKRGLRTIKKLGRKLSRAPTCGQIIPLQSELAATPSGGIQENSAVAQAVMIQGLLGFDASTNPEQVVARVKELLQSPSGGGEKWTRETVEGIWNKCSTEPQALKAIADAHNATLQPQVGSALDMLCQAEDCTELTSGFCAKHTPKK